MKEKQYLPVLLDVTEKRILMVGAGIAASEKLRTLAQLGKEVIVISPEVNPEFLNREWIKVIQRNYQKGDLRGFQIVYCGVNDREVEEMIRAEATEEGILLNVIDRVEHSDFISPSALIKKSFAIFVSTYGKGPGMTKKIRQMIEEKLDLVAIDKEAEAYIQQRLLDRTAKDHIKNQPIPLSEISEK